MATRSLRVVQFQRGPRSSSIWIRRTGLPRSASPRGSLGPNDSVARFNSLSLGRDGIQIYENAVYGDLGPELHENSMRESCRARAASYSANFRTDERNTNQIPKSFLRPYSLHKTSRPF